MRTGCCDVKDTMFKMTFHIYKCNISGTPQLWYHPEEIGMSASDMLHELVELWHFWQLLSYQNGFLRLIT